MKTNWKNMGKRFLSFLMAFAMLLSMAEAILPAVRVKAAETTGNTEHNSSVATFAIDPSEGTKMQAENAKLFWPADTDSICVMTDHHGYSGTGFIAGPFNKAGQYIEYPIEVQQAGTYTLQVRYANGNADACEYAIYLDDEVIDNHYYVSTYGWQTWGIYEIEIDLTSDVSSLKFVAGSGVGNGINVDYLTLIPKGTGDADNKVTISVLGDSISTFVGISSGAGAKTSNSTIFGNADSYSPGRRGVYLEDTWWQQTAEALGGRILVNNSWSGSHIFNEVSSSPNAYADRCVQLHDDTGANNGETPDIIALYLGTNDCNMYPSQLGTAADINYDTLIVQDDEGGFTYTKPTTVSEAYAIMVHKMTQRYPDAEIYCFTILECIDHSAEKRAQTKGFNASVAAIADKFGAYVVDLDNDSGIKDNTFFDAYMPDSLHPGPEGMDAITNCFLSSIYKNSKLPQIENDTTYTVSYSLTNTAVEQGTAKVVLGGKAFSCDVHAFSGAPSEVTVTMGGTDITSSAYTDGKIEIPEVTGDIIIVATAEEETEMCGDVFQNNSVEPMIVLLDGVSKHEAENAMLTWPVDSSSRIGINTDHTGYSGTGFIDRLTSNPGACIGFPINVQQAGKYVLRVRYANGGYQSPNFNIYVDNVLIDTHGYAPTGSWDNWAVYEVALDLSTDSKSVKIVAGDDIDHAINIDCIEIQSVVSVADDRLTISILADSISTYQDVSNGAAANTSNSTIAGNSTQYQNGWANVYLEDTWWQQAADVLGASILVNNSWAGSEIFNWRNSTPPAYEDRCVQLHDDTGINSGETPDIIAVYIGFNDYARHPDQLGTAANIDYDTLITSDGAGGFTYATPTTVAEAYAVMIHKMMQRYPDSEIYCFTLAKFPASGTSKANVEALNASIVAIAEKFGIYVVDLYNDSCIQDDAFFSTCMVDSAHPRCAGMDAITSCFLSSVYSNSNVKHIENDVTYTISASLTSTMIPQVKPGVDRVVASGNPFSCDVYTISGNASDVQVTMGGADITSEVYADGKIAIPEVTGNVAITATVENEAGMTGDPVHNNSVATWVISPNQVNKQEAENARMLWRADLNYKLGINTNHTGYSGTGFVECFQYNPGAYIEFPIEVRQADKYALKICYANGGTQSPEFNIYVDDVLLDTHGYASTGAWTNWGIYEIEVELSTNAKSLKIVAGEDIQDGINLDYVSIQSSDTIQDVDFPSITEVDQYDNYDTFTISTAEEFAALGTNIKAGYSYEGKTVLVTADLDFSAYKGTNWTPVGTATDNYSGTGFKGHFDGQLHHFKNINMKFTGNRQGLFGFIDGAVIENIILDEGTLTAVNSRYSGVLSASASGSTIRNIENHITFVNSVNNEYWNVGFVSHCTGTTFEAIVNYGSIKGLADKAQENGGFFAWGAGNCTVSHCYMAGTVTGTSSDILGRGRGTTTNSYYLTADDTGTISKADFISGQTAWNLNTLSGTQSNASIWFASENGPVLKATDTTSVSNLDQYDNYETFTISTAKEFAALGTNITAGYSYEGKTILVTADLDFSAYKDTYWTPIGTATGNYSGTPFKGHFDGQFHHFKNINMKLQGNHKGLFGYIQNAVIENIILDEGTLTAVNSRYSGILFATSSGSKIRNIENHVSFVNSINNEYWNVGFASHCDNTTFEAIVNYGSIKGLADKAQENGGFFAWGRGNCTLNHCYMAGTVTGTSSDILGRGRGTTTNSYYLTADDKGTITKADFISGKTAWNLNTFTGTKENAGLWSTTENGPVLNPNKATYTVKVSKFDVDGNTLGETTYYCNQGDTFTLDTAGFKIPVCTLNDVALDSTSFTVPKTDSVVTIVETRTDFVISPTKVNKAEAEYADLIAGVYELGINTNHAGYSGTGFVELFQYNPGAYIEFPIEVRQTGTYALKICYANGGTQSPEFNVYVNDVLVDTHSFAPTGAWTKWGFYEVTVDLSTEAKSLKIVAGDEIEDGINIDYISIQADQILDFDIPSVTDVEQYYSADFFTISTAEEFAALATNVNAGYTYEGKNVLVIADLDFSAYKDTYWTPVGAATANYTGTPFKGHFDGRFHHFKNINMKLSGNHKGLFGVIQNAVIENIILDEGTLTAVNSRYSGILFATSSSSKIRNIENHVSFVNSVANEYWNVGFASHCDNTTFEAIVNYGSIKGLANMAQDNGGFFAWGRGNCTLNQCYMAGTVTGTASDILGRGQGKTTNSYYLTADDKGTISKADFTSGVAAWDLNTLSGTRENAGLWSIGENGPVLNPEKAVYAMQGVALDKDSKQFRELNVYVNLGDVVTIADLPGYTFKALERDGVQLETGWIMSDQDTEGYTFYFENNTYSISYELNGGDLPEDAAMTHTSGFAQTLPLAKREGYGFKGWYDNAQLQGEPIFAVPADQYSDVTYYAAWGELIEISTAQQLASITDLSGCYILSADIDLTGVEFAPIGSVENPFVGSFDGNGYVISNLKIESDGTYQGLFGYNAGIISNVKLDDTCYISGNVHVGAIAGCNAGGVYNCSTEATVAYNQPELTSYKLMCQNLCMWGSGDFSVANRQPRMLDRIYANSPDIIAFQEGTEEWVNYLAENLTGYTLLYKYRASDSKESVPVAYKTDMFDEVESGHFWLSPTPEVQSVGWDAALPRICTYVVLRDKTSGDMMALFNVHLDHAGNNARIQGGALIRERMDILLQRYPEIMLFAAGDFNCNEGSDGYNSITGTPMADARYIADVSTDVHTYYADLTENWVNTGGGTCDFIATYEPTVHVSKFEVLGECVNGTRLSDHNGIAATYTVKTGIAIGGVVGTNEGVILRTVSNANVVGGEENGMLIGANNGIAEKLYYSANTIPAVGSGDATGCVEFCVEDLMQQVSLKDDLAMNFVFGADEITTVKVIFDGNVTELDLSAMTPDENGKYTVSVNLAAAQMTEEIQLQFVNGDVVLLEKTYSIRSYAEEILAGDYTDDTKNLVKAMLNYGAKAQLYFGVNKDNLANAGYELDAVTLPTEYEEMVVSGSVDSLKFYGASLVFKNKIAVRFYFTGSVNGVSFGDYEVVQKGDMYYVEVADINPQDYSKLIALTATKGEETLTVSYSPLNYILRMSEKGSDSLKDLLNALYGYHEAAVQYVSEQTDTSAT